MLVRVTLAGTLSALALAVSALSGAALGRTHSLSESPVGVDASAPAIGESEAEAALAAAERAIERKDLERARVHLERAVAGDTTTRGRALLLMADLARESNDLDALARATLGWTDLTMGPQGRGIGRPPRGAFDTGKGGVKLAALATQIAKTRVGAVMELSAAASSRESKGARRPEQLLTAAWARRFGLDLAQRSPRVLDAAEAALDPAVHAPRDAHGPVLKALARVAEKSLSNAQPGTAARAARMIHGLGVQADFMHLRGARPLGMAKWRAKGAELLARARARLIDDSEQPWTVEELEWLASDEGEAFTREHDDFSTPGVAVSPRGWYRIESDCGYETLLGVASTIEDHHARLADLFGSDPFNASSPRQGLVRIVPDPSGLEAEGAPFFWVGGFQSGDTTVMRHSVGTIFGLGRTLTHELTHRFDGALHPGIPAWLAEGRAVWTGAAYARTTDDSFLAEWCAFGTMQSVLGGGLTSERSLEAIVSGEPEDYRRNYTVGNALYVFLRTWFPGDAMSLSEGTPLFAARLEAFEESGSQARRPKERLEEFEDAFCDGKGGRPASFTAFREMFVEFLQGFDRREPADWRKRYTGRHLRGERGEWVYDEPTWTWDWSRAEPVFGQNQARVAGLFLLEQGETEAALRALVWARAVDGYDRRTSDGLLAILGGAAKSSIARREALWATRHERRGEPFASVLRAKDARAFPAKLSAVSAHLEALEEGVATLRAAGAPCAADRLALDAGRVAAWIGAVPTVVPMIESGAAPVAVFDEQLGDWVEEELTRLDKDRPSELFAFEDDGGLLLGRREKRDGSGRFDRRGGGKSFVRASRWMLPGSYSVRTNVRFTTGFNTAVIVVGWTSRERNVRMHIIAGDWKYAAGEKDEEPKFDTIRWRFDGMRTRDAGLPGSARAGAIELGSSSTAVSLEIRVEGSAFSAWIAGQYVGTYHTIDGSPIEGYIGFGTSNGAVRLAPPIARRTDGEPERVAGARGPIVALDLIGGTGPPFDKLENQRVYFGVDRQSVPNGTLMLWFPSRSKSDAIRGRDDGDDAVGAAVKRAKRSAETLIRRMARRDIVQPLLIVLPERFREKVDVAALEAEFAGRAADGLSPPRIVFHAVEPQPEVNDDGEEPRDEFARSIDQGRRWLLFLDASDVVRTAVPWIGATALEDPGIEHWLSVFRDHGHPERPLPKAERPPPEEEEDGER